MAASELEDVGKLTDVFDKIWSIYEELENTTELSGSETVQSLVYRAISLTEKAVHMVNELSLFSSNEQIDEVASRDIRYMLLPALLGYFTNKNQKVDRFDAVCKSQTYFIDFIRLCKMYELTSCELPKAYVKSSDSTNQQLQSVPRANSGPLSMDEQTRKREQKIEQLKRRQRLEQTIKDLTHYVKQEHVDDEHIRQFYLTLVSKWLADAADNLESFEIELPILEHMSFMKSKTNSESVVKSKPQQAPMRPFIITKNEVQKAVFGIGYPGIPTVTVNEFYEQRVREGLFPSAEQQQGCGHDHGGTAKPPVKQGADREAEEARQKEKEAEEAEKKAEVDDEESLSKQRNWDDWKDDHRRGWGNTQNKG